ncbi:hypothetical protein SAMN05444165_5476 [Paraburkholderia phenazinium]|jgi:hypothetical protein|uniref:Uncharacterized protein n=2 Tax=Burkholderiaceae TaxID=119060 RepID=A0A1N6L0E1_9BURK|nr:hypothetical protein SAMN05444165_5476 [Paraburkholderia phenazinium]
MMDMRSWYREIGMLLNEYRRLAAWLGRAIHKAPVDTTTPAATTSSAFDFDPMWHGDHWQNLLSSPMDARHYVMEDWSVVTDTDFETAGLAAQIR